MKKSDKERNAEVLLYTLEEIQKIITGFIPGGHLIDGFWNFRSGLKQKRLLDFAESLKKLLEKELGNNLKNYHFETEDFVDVFDSIMNKVQYTKSETKLNSFKAIIVNSIKCKSDLTQVYIDLISKLNDKEIEMLKHFMKSEQSRKKKIEQIYKFKSLLDNKQSNVERLKRLAQIGEIQPHQSISSAQKEETFTYSKLIQARKDYEIEHKSINSKMLGISEGEFEYYYTDLIANGLIKTIQFEPFRDSHIKLQYIVLTKFGTEFFQFITI